MIKKYLSENLKTSIDSVNLDNATEIRLRLNKPVFVVYGTDEKELSYKSSYSDIEDTFLRICHYSPFAYIEDIKRGYITIDGGCRVGICGTVVEGNNVKNISSLNIRLAREYIGCSKIISDIVSGNVLIASPPACGKTTLLRDYIRHLSNGGYNVCVADERGEISGSDFDLGKRTDVILNCKKSDGMEMLLRSMSPNIIAVDELGGQKDIQAVENIIHSGVNIVATIHCKNMEEIKFRLGDLYQVFDYIVILSGIGRIEKIYNRERIIC